MSGTHESRNSPSPESDFYDSGSLTHPNTPVAWNSEEDPLEFARLVPHNQAALIAFNEIAQKMVAIETWQPHSRRFIVVDPGFTQLESDPDSASESETTSKAVDVRTGHYRLSLNQPPDNQNLGWVIGRGRPTYEVDILLCEESGQDVAGRHCRILHNDMGVLMIHSDNEKRPLTLDGKSRVANERRAFTTPTTGITIGRLHYLLQFTGLAESVYKEGLARLRKARGVISPKISPHLTITPSEHHYVVSGFSIHNIIDKGSTCHVHCALNINNGNFYAAKQMRYQEKTEYIINREVEVMQSIGRNPRVIELCKVLRPNIDYIAVPRIVEAFLIYSPLCYSSMSSIVTSNLSDDERYKLFQQCIEGLEFIHSRGFMHRDIKLQNIGIRWDDRPHAVYLDFGCATSEEGSIEHGVGTIPYLVPEVMALKNGSSARPYDKASDVWSLGLTLFQLLSHKIWEMTSIEKHIYEKIISSIHRSSAAEGIYMKTVEKMLAWGPEQRPHITDIMKRLGLNTYTCSSESAGVYKRKSEGTRNETDNSQVGT